MQQLKGRPSLAPDYMQKPLPFPSEKHEKSDLEFVRDTVFGYLFGAWSSGGFDIGSFDDSDNGKY